MAPITYDHVTKEFSGGMKAVNDLTIEVKDGEFLVLVGPSGCGKTTALRMLAGLEEISDGRILIGERIVNNIDPGARDIAMVFQSYALYPHMTVYDNLAFGLRNKGIQKDEIDRRVNDAAKVLDLDGMLKRKPKQLSGGQRQRVALGRAIVREPAAFLMDEPLSNLDAALRVQTRAEILKLQRRLATTTLYVTHDQVEAMTMGDRIAVMRLGLLQQIGTPEELYTKPANLFVAGFIGSPAMNLIRVTPSVNGRVALQHDAFVLELPSDLADAVRTTLSGEIVAGLRPEHFVVAHDGESRLARSQGIVEVVEYLGDELLAHVRAGDVELVAKLPVEERLAPGDAVTLGIPPEKLHLFDAKDERALSLT
jgi:multiple sugar transport system ATP-binding protein